MNDDPKFDSKGHSQLAAGPNGHRYDAFSDAPSDPDRDPVEELAAEFSERLRNNERPSIEDYAARHLELADEIRDLFPTIAEMERLNRRRQTATPRLTNRLSFPFEQLGDFRVIGEIGRGGMGIVYEAEQVTLGRRVAVKVLPSQALRGPKDIQRFQREARTAACLHHSNIVPVFGVGEQEGAHYIVMQFIQGVGLDEILEELRRIARVPGAKEEDPALSDSDRSKYIRHNAAALMTEKLRRDSRSTQSVDMQREGSLSRPSSTKVGPADPAPATNLRSVPADHRVPAAGKQSPRATSTDANEGAKVGTVSRGEDLGNTTSPRSPQADSPPAQPALRFIGPEYWRNVARIGVQAAEGLHYAHAHGTLHRDVKPGNLLLDSDGVVWIADFGLAKAAEQENVTWTGDVVGTLCYLAPERFEEEADARSDVYSLGLTLYEMLTLRRAYQCRDRAALVHQISNHEVTPPRKLNPAIPRDLETIVLKAISRDPEDRFRTAGELAADLENFLEDRPIQARRISPAERLARWCRRNRAVAGLTAAVAVLLVAVTVVATIGYARESAERQRAEANSHQAEINEQQAVMTANLATEALDSIYGQFAPNPVLVSSEPPLDEDEEAELLTAQASLPLTGEVAILLERLLDYYDRLSKHAVNSQEVLTKSVMATRRVGDIHYRLRDYDKAVSAYQRAIDRYKEMGSNAAESAEMRIELARIYNGLGMAYRHQLKPAESYEAHLQALELLDADAASPIAQYELAQTQYLLHLALHGRFSKRQEGHFKLGGRESEQDRLQVAIEILDDLVERASEVPEYRFLLAQCYLEKNKTPIHKNWDRSSHCDNEAVQILTSLVKEHPEVSEYRYVLGDALLGQASHYCKNAKRGDRHEATLKREKDRLLKALEVTANLDVDFPNIPQYVVLKSHLHSRLAGVYEGLNRVEEAVEQFRIASNKQEMVIRASIEPEGPQFVLAYYQWRLARMLRKLNRWDEAQEVLDRRIHLLSELADRPAADHGRICGRAKDLLWQATSEKAGWEFYGNTWGRLEQ